MTQLIPIAIIGAGMAGLSAARALAEAGHAPVIFDKGRGIGGRLATRRGGDLQFDHGAQYVTARDPGFAALLAAMQQAGAAAAWDDGSGRAHIVGVPGMRALAKYLGQGLDVRQRHEGTALTETPEGWRIALGERVHHARRVVVTAPAPQIGALIGEAHPVARQIADVRLAPCLTLMAAFAPGGPRPFAARRDPDDALPWIALDSSKPGRAGADCWVAQAAPGWSRAHLDDDPAVIASRMLSMLCERIGADPADALHATAHRWRYAAVETPLGQPFARNDAGTIHAGGDWCLEARIEAAWLSGTAIARNILGPR